MHEFGMVMWMWMALNTKRRDFLLMSILNTLFFSIPYFSFFTAIAPSIWTRARKRTC